MSKLGSADAAMSSWLGVALVRFKYTFQLPFNRPYERSSEDALLRNSRTILLHVRHPSAQLLNVQNEFILRALLRLHKRWIRTFPGRCTKSFQVYYLFSGPLVLVFRFIFRVEKRRSPDIRIWILTAMEDDNCCWAHDVRHRVVLDKTTMRTIISQIKSALRRMSLRTASSTRVRSIAREVT